MNTRFTLTTTPAVPLGAKMRCDIGNSDVITGEVVATNADAMFVETTDGSFYKVNRATWKDQDGDRWELDLPTRKQYYNVYTDGSQGLSHDDEEAARLYSRYGKVRVGILEITYRGSAVSNFRMIPTEPQLRTSAKPDGYNPYA